MSALAVDILSDILQHSAFDATELERERTVILQEIGQAQDTPDDIIFDLFQECAYPDQPMGQPVLGRADIIKSLTRDQVANYLKSTYAAPGMLMVAAGNITHEVLVAMAERAFNALGAKSEARTEPGHYDGGEHRELRELEQAHVVLGFPGLSLHRSRLFRRLGGVDRVRRRHVLAPLPGGAREARPRLFDLFLQPFL